MVVCGSLHPVARRQIAAIAGAPIAGRVTVLATPLPDVVPVSAEEARRASEALAERFHRLTTTSVSSPMSALATVVIIGGDTAAALLGDATVRVGGTVAAGVPWIRMDDGRLFVTRAGGFGTDTSLVELFTAGMDT